MTEQSAIDTAVRRLALALDALDAAVERRKQADRSEEGLAAQCRPSASTARDWPRHWTATARSRRLEQRSRNCRAARYRDRINPVCAGSE